MASRSMSLALTVPLWAGAGDTIEVEVTLPGEPPGTRRGPMAVATGALDVGVCDRPPGPVPFTRPVSTARLSARRRTKGDRITEA